MKPHLKFSDGHHLGRLGPVNAQSTTVALVAVGVVLQRVVDVTAEHGQVLGEPASTVKQEERFFSEKYKTNTRN
jgi:hypothetical protein